MEILFDSNAEGKKIYVAECSNGTVAEVDFRSGRVDRRFRVGARPAGIAIAEHNKLLLVNNSGRNSVSIIDLISGKERACVQVSREPVSVEVAPDESVAVVTSLLSERSSLDVKTAATVNIIDLNSFKCVADILLPAGSTLLRGIVISPDGHWAYAVHTLGRYMMPTTQLERGWIQTNAFSIIDLKERTCKATMLLDSPDKGAALPWGVTLSEDGSELWISISGVHKIAKIDISGFHKFMDKKFNEYSRQ